MSSDSDSSAQTALVAPSGGKVLLRLRRLTATPRRAAASSAAAPSAMAAAPAAAPTSSAVSSDSMAGSMPAARRSASEPRHEWSGVPVGVVRVAPLPTCDERPPMPSSLPRSAPPHGKQHARPWWRTSSMYRARQMYSSVSSARKSHTPSSGVSPSRRVANVIPPPHL